MKAPVRLFDAGAEVCTAPALDDQSVYFAAENVRVFAVDIVTGK